MPSLAHQIWHTVRSSRLDEILHAHAAVLRAAPEERQPARQLTHAYAILLAVEFQGFCRDLHSEISVHLATWAAQHHAQLAEIVQDRLLDGRKLSQGGPNSAHVGSDFGRFGIDFWHLVDCQWPDAPAARRRLDELVRCRNAIAHSDFTVVPSGRQLDPELGDVRGWHENCDLLVEAFDAITGEFLLEFVGPDWAWS